MRKFYGMLALLILLAGTALGEDAREITGEAGLPKKITDGHYASFMEIGAGERLDISLPADQPC